MTLEIEVVHISEVNCISNVLYRNIIIIFDFFYNWLHL